MRKIWPTRFLVDVHPSLWHGRGMDDIASPAIRDDHWEQCPKCRYFLEPMGRPAKDGEMKRCIMCPPVVAPVQPMSPVERLKAMVAAIIGTAIIILTVYLFFLGLWKFIDWTGWDKGGDSTNDLPELEEREWRTR